MQSINLEKVSGGHTQEVARQNCDNDHVDQIQEQKRVSPKTDPEGACYKEQCNIEDNVSLFLCLCVCVCVCEGKRTFSLQLSCISTGCFLQLAFGINSRSQPKTFVLEFQDCPPTAYPHMSLWAGHCGVRWTRKSENAEAA